MDDSGKPSTPPSPRSFDAGRGRSPEPVRPAGRARDAGPPAAREAVEPPPREPLAPIEVPTREFSLAGQPWLATSAGRTVSGLGPDAHATLLLVFFAPLPEGAAPPADLPADPPSPTREALTVAPDLDHLSDQDLADLCARARPHAAMVGRTEVFTDTRKKGQKGL